MRSTSSFCHRINLLNEDLNVRASSLGGVAEAEELHPEPPFPPSEYVPTFRSSFKRFTRWQNDWGLIYIRNFHPLAGQNEKIQFWRVLALKFGFKQKTVRAWDQPPESGKLGNNGASANPTGDWGGRRPFPLPSSSLDFFAPRFLPFFAPPMSLAPIFQRLDSAVL